MVTGTGDGLAWAVVPAERPVLRSAGGVLLVHEVRRLGLSLLPVVAWRLLLATALAVAVAALAAWLLAGRLTAPLGRLVTAARRVGEGDLSTRVHVDGDGEIAEVASAFNDMAAGLERAQGEQRAFLASVGHELKTPLTTVQGYTEALLDGTVDDPAERRRSLVRVHAETIRLARLVQDLLDLARLGRGQFAVSTVDADVGAVLREAAAAAAERAARRQVTVTTRLTGTLHAHVDPGRLRQVLDNLLDNASPLQPVRPPGPGRGPPPRRRRGRGGHRRPGPGHRPRGPPPRLRPRLPVVPLPRHPGGRVGPRPGHRQGPLRRHGRRHPGRVRPRRRHRLPPHPPPAPHPPRQRPPPGRARRPASSPPAPCGEPAPGYEPPAGGFDSLISRRCPSGSRKKQRTSHS